VLLLFDIDGTLLLGANREHGLAMFAALEEVFGITDPKTAQLDPSGRTDGEIARLILREHGVPEDEIDEGAAAVRDATCAAFERLCPADYSDKVSPGAVDVLEAMRAQPQTKLALLTGNYEPIARLKMERAGLAGYFPSGQGAFGSDHEDRPALVPIARQRAGTNGTPQPRERTAIIGDTPRDIACARADGVHVLTVATGRYTVDQLADADGVVADARGLLGLLTPLVDRRAA
jgi:phosphoglycolate phosphatase